MKKEDENPAFSEDVKLESSPASSAISHTGAEDRKAVDGNRRDQPTLSGFTAELAKISLEKIAIYTAAVFAVVFIFFLFHLKSEVRHLQEKNAALESQLKILRENSESANTAIMTLQNQLIVFEQQVSQNLDKQQAVIRALQHSRKPEDMPNSSSPANPESRDGIKKNDDPRQNYIDFVESVVKKLFTIIRNIFDGTWEFLTGLAS